MEVGIQEGECVGGHFHWFSGMDWLVESKTGVALLKAMGLCRGGWIFSLIQGYGSSGFRHWVELVCNVWKTPENIITFDSHMAKW